MLTRLSLCLCGLGMVAGLPFAAPATAAEILPGRLTPKLLVTLPDYVVTPDGMAVDGAGNLVVACPNFADPSKPGCLIKIDRQRRVTKWVEVPVLPETGHAYPMGIEFGPDGDLYVCDNQNWPTGNGKEGELNQGRILRLRIRGNRLEQTTVVAHSISHPNGCRVRDGYLYVTVSMLPKIRRADGLLVSGVYRFGLAEQNVAVTNTEADQHLFVTFVTQNRDCQYGADGIAFDEHGNLVVGNFGDGALHRVTLDKAGHVTGNTVFAKTDMATPMSSPDFQEKMVQAKMRTTDGICFDKNGNIYVADFSNNAVAIVNPHGQITVLAQSPDGDGRTGGLNQPGEPIVWDGKLVLTCFDMVTGPDKVNTKHDSPATIAYLELP